MDKTKTFIQQNPKWQVLEEYILRIEGYVNSNPGLVIENCKSLIESILKTIIIEIKKKSPDELNEDSIGKLYKQIKEILQLGDKKYSRIIGSFSSAIAEFRNSLGETSHGKDIYTLEENKNSLFTEEINFLLDTTDSVAFFLLNYYSSLYPHIANKRQKLRYDDYSDFNEWFDEQEPAVVIREIELSPSQVLFENDQEAYKAYLLEYQEVDDLIEELKNSPNFASTHQIIYKLSQYQHFSKPQVKQLWQAFIQNNQIHWIATDKDIENFYKTLFIENRELFTDKDIATFLSYYNTNDVV